MEGIEFLDDILALCLSAVLVVLVFRRFRIPPIIGLITTGIILGPTGFHLVTDSEIIKVLAELGVTMLLFSIGLEFSLDELIKLKKIVLIGGPLQIILCAAVIAIAAILGAMVVGEAITWQAAAVIGMCMCLSSTAICIKLIKDRGELGQPHARAVLGILIFQDLAVVPIMVVLNMLRPGAQFSVTKIALELAGLALAMVVLTLVLRWLLPRVVKYVTHTDSPEVLVLGALGICFGAALVTGHLGLSMALGAFIAGAAIAGSEDSHHINGVMEPIRDLFTSIFFMSVGLLLNVQFAHLHVDAISAIAVILCNAAVVAVLLRGIGLRWRVATMAGVILAEVGEFSFVLATSALNLNVINNETYQSMLVTIIITMVVTPTLVALAPRVATVLTHEA
jgi:CPA2 family monovalent cation:H+ antiporter-2